MPQFYENGLVWLRRDLRLDDHSALQAALQACRAVHLVFVLDRNILGPLPRHDRRVEFILGCLQEIDAALRERAGHADAGLIVLHGDPVQAIPQLAAELGCGSVFVSHDDEPTSLARDAAVGAALRAQGRSLATCKDHVLFERQEVLTQAGKPYTVFTPYKRAWMTRLRAEPPVRVAAAGWGHQLAPRPATRSHPPPTLADIGFQPTNLRALKIPTGEAGAQQLLADFLRRMDDYQRTRDFPAVKGPSYLGMHLRFGAVSIRRLAGMALERLGRGAVSSAQAGGAETWLSELAWRDFYAQILANFPHVAGNAFKREMDAIEWEEGPEAEARFAAWCEGRTGYPLVDAAMHQLLQTGYMHNRLRMVSASFLVKDLGIDWRRGEAWFARHLNDFDLASNNGGWQWSASTGCDAQPWFRIFNPVTQSEKFDPQGKFIRRYLPQLADLPEKWVHAPWLPGRSSNLDYPPPIVDHAAARGKTLLRYGAVSKPGTGSSKISESYQLDS